ncbi:Fluoroacetyl-CoA thioesterase [bioreactor metagenome]|uniref:Fluoroacetyl-CoA thioesterase n=1 Tax=bioreactor metagenome TaxID=1076179 RepID=A0A645AR95_9ZZZZ|nr:thioesterase family protein [Candidatus Metalachnospira sp.]
MDFGIKEGIKNTMEFTVTHADTADAAGNKGINVLASPVMICWIEQTCLKAVLPLLPEGYDTVGTSFNFLHLAATPVGQKVRVEAELTEVVKGKMLTFEVKVYDEKGKICKGTHGRAVVNREQFFGNL